MAKYGKGLGLEFAFAVKNGLVEEPFTVKDVKKFAQSRGWNPSSDYVSSILSNGSSPYHSPTNKKYFIPLGNGFYVLSLLGQNIIL